MSIDYAKARAEEARLDILTELHRQNDDQLSERLLREALFALGHKRSPDYLRVQLRKLEELGAVHLTEVGDVLIAKIEPPGVHHLERAHFLDGVKRPIKGG